MRLQLALLKIYDMHMHARLWSAVSMSSSVMTGAKVEEHRERRAAERAEKQRLAEQLQVPARTHCSSNPCMRALLIMMLACMLLR